MDDGKCRKCKKLVGEGESGIQCDGCDLWFHAGCVGIDDREYSLISRMSSFDWMCKGCKEKIKNLKQENKKLKEENQTLSEENRLLKERLSALEERMNGIICEIKDELKAEIMGSVMEGVMDQVSEVLKIKSEIIEEVG